MFIVPTISDELVSRHQYKGKVLCKDVSFRRLSGRGKAAVGKALLCTSSMREDGLGSGLEWGKGQGHGDGWRDRASSHTFPSQGLSTLL